jgi:hypothetical protein
MSTSHGNSPGREPAEQTLFDQNLSQSAEEEDESRWPSQERFPLNEEGREDAQRVSLGRTCPGRVRLSRFASAGSS